MRFANGHSPPEEDTEDQRWIVRLTLRARADIDAAASFLAESVSDAYADAWQNGLLEATGKLARFPARYALVSEAMLFHEPVRQFLYAGIGQRRRSGPAWRVLFIMRENASDRPTIHILHVRHSAQAAITADEAQTLEDMDWE